MKLLKQSGAMYLVEYLIMAAAVIGSIAFIGTFVLEPYLNESLEHLGSSFGTSLAGIDTVIGALPKP